MNISQFAKHLSSSVWSLLPNINTTRRKEKKRRNLQTVMSKFSPPPPCPILLPPSFYFFPAAAYITVRASRVQGNVAEFFFGKEGRPYGRKISLTLRTASQPREANLPCQTHRSLLGHSPAITHHPAACMLQVWCFRCAVHASC